MNNAPYSHGSGARGRIAAVFLVTIVAGASLLLFGALPLHREAERLQRRLDDVHARIRAFASAGIEPLEEQLARERRESSALAAMWDTLRETVRTFPGETRLDDLLATSEEGRIDYKVALYDARQRIAKEADLRGIEVPPDLGMVETVGADEVMESKLWQLATIVVLTERLLEEGATSILSMEALDPIAYSLSSEPDRYLLLYPVRFVVQCPYSVFLQFLESIGRPRSFFALQRLRVEDADPASPRNLIVRFVCSALRFHESPPAAKAEEPELDAMYLPAEGDWIMRVE
jgi:hypothetical protein